MVSLTAVFLALAIGLIVGTSALNGPLSDNLKHQVTQLTGQNSQYRAQLNQLDTEVADKEKFATEVAPLLLANKLQGRRVLVVSMQNSSQYVDDMVADLKLAGVKVTGDVEIEDLFVKPASNIALLELAQDTLTTLNPTINGLPANSDGVETSTALLAAVLMERQPAAPSGALTTVLSAYKNAKFISYDAGVTEPAEAVIVLATPPYSDEDASAENANTVTMIDQFDNAGPIVVGAAGDAGAGNIINAVTSDASLSKTVSTVDNIDTPQGEIAATLALHEQLVLGKTGHYGVSSSATSLLPTPPAS